MLLPEILCSRALLNFFLLRWARVIKLLNLFQDLIQMHNLYGIKGEDKDYSLLWCDTMYFGR
jgi:hypothetical protein